MINSENKLFNEEQVIDYLFKPCLESLNKVCEYAMNEPEITRISVLRIGEYCIDIAVWLTDASAENCDKYGLGIYTADKDDLVFPAYFYSAGRQLDRGLVIYERPKDN